MLKMVVTLPISHKFQAGRRGQRWNPAKDYCSPIQERGFISVLRRLCLSYKIKLLAEEFCQEHEALYRIKETTCKRVARSLNVAHSYCDLPRDQRPGEAPPTQGEILSQKAVPMSVREVQIKALFEAKEDFWLRAIMDLNKWPCLFAFGGDHERSFISRLVNMGVEVVALPQLLDSFRTAKEYLGSVGGLEHG